MTTLPGETQACNALVLACKNTYAAEAFHVEHDKLHKSLGDERTQIGVYCDQVRRSTDALMVQMELVVQFYGHYAKEVKRTQQVDPAVVHAFAERLRVYLKNNVVDPRSSEAWYFRVEKTTYPDDPTGNKTRYEMHLTCFGSNTTY